MSAQAERCAAVVSGEVYFALHTGDPGVGGDQTMFEANYPGYSRVAVSTSIENWVERTDGMISPVEPIDFPQSFGDHRVARHFSIGMARQGRSAILARGTVTPNIALSAMVVPRLTEATIIPAEAIWGENR